MAPQTVGRNLPQHLAVGQGHAVAPRSCQCPIPCHRRDQGRITLGPKEDLHCFSLLQRPSEHVQVDIEAQLLRPAESHVVTELRHSSAWPQFRPQLHVAQRPTPVGGRVVLHRLTILICRLSGAKQLLQQDPRALLGLSLRNACLDRGLRRGWLLRLSHGRRWRLFAALRLRIALLQELVYPVHVEVPDDVDLLFLQHLWRPQSTVRALGIPRVGLPGLPGLLYDPERCLYIPAVVQAQCLALVSTPTPATAQVREDHRADGADCKHNANDAEHRGPRGVHLVIRAGWGVTAAHLNVEGAVRCKNDARHALDSLQQGCGQRGRPALVAINAEIGGHLLGQLGAGARYACHDQYGARKKL
mmetsp:Transcript_11496/g.35604  ORF Transcript_11496/g.35604 Transcript_11496/m.35604 type:complete len:359 (+) Transcript_11496:567-1643(+)